jgi:rhodanese-related sulfurtransferase
VAAKLPARPDTAQAVAALPSLDPIAPAAVGAALLVDLRAGMSYRKSHPRGAVWAIRPRLDAVVKAAAGRPLVLIADEEAVARAAALDLAAAGAGPLSLLDGGFAAWQAAGLPVESTPELPSNADCIDYLFFVHDRHEGNREAAMQYLAWETHLIEQLDAQELSGFRVSAG